MQKYNIPASRVIRHYDVWGKVCPAPFVNNPEQWEDFKKRLTESEGLSVTQYEELKKLITENKEQVFHYLKDVPEWGQPTIKKLWDKGYFKGESADDLNLPYSYAAIPWKVDTTLRSLDIEQYETCEEIEYYIEENINNYFLPPKGTERRSY
jgi:hypothetical protein